MYFVHNCLQFLQLFSFAHTTYKPSHRSHTIIPLSNHHTIIIPKSIELRNILYIYISSSLSCVSSNNTIPTKGVDFNNNKTISFFRVHHHKKPRSWLWWVFCLEEHSSSSRAFALAGSRDVHIVKIITLLSCFCVISFVSSVHF